jgi:nucleoside-diphosphate-sugar epimerase
MKALFIGGTGTISTSICHLAVQNGWDLTVINRGTHNDRLPKGVTCLTADVNNMKTVDSLIGSQTFDVIADFIAFKPHQVDRDIQWFKQRCGQYIFISSASAYKKPPNDYRITESTPLANPYWDYAQNKIACEERLVEAYRKEQFPMTIVRPSHTYGDWRLPVSIHGKNGPWETILRMKQGKPVLVIGDGTSLWTVTNSRDFARGFLGLMGHPAAIGEAVHITSDEALPWNTIYQIIGDVLGVQPRLFHVSSDALIARDPSLRGPLLGDKCNSVVFDNSKLKRLVPGYWARIRFDQGARLTLAYMEQHPEEQKRDPDWDAWTEQVIREETACRTAHLRS